MWICVKPRRIVLDILASSAPLNGPEGLAECNGSRPMVAKPQELLGYATETAGPFRNCVNRPEMRAHGLHEQLPVSTTLIYDHRKLRPEHTPTFKVKY